MDSLDLAKAAASLPLTVLLVLVLVGGYVEWWIYGSIHRTALEEKDEIITLERDRADRWEGRFLEIGMKIDTINHAVNGSSILAAQKLSDLETQISGLHSEIGQIQSLRVIDAQRLKE